MVVRNLSSSNLEELIKRNIALDELRDGGFFSRVFKYNFSKLAQWRRMKQLNTAISEEVRRACQS